MSVLRNRIKKSAATFDRIIFRSFAGKLTFWLFLLMSAFFTAKTVIDYGILSENVYEYDKNKFITELNAVKAVICDSINNAELTIAASMPTLQLLLDHPDSLTYVTRHLLSTNKSAFGCAIAMEPYFYKGSRNFMLYSCRDSTGSILTFSPDSVAYSYRDKQWYSAVRQSMKARWSEPYFDRHVSDRYMCTYSSPITDADGNFAGVLTADVLIADYSKMIERLKPYDDERCYAEIVSDDGYFIASPHCRNGSLVNVREIEGYNKAMADFIIANETGYQIETVAGEECLVVHSLVDKNIGWRLILICPTSIIFHNLKVATIWIVAINTLLTVLILIMIYFSVHNILRPITRFTKAVGELPQRIDEPLEEINGVSEVTTLRDTMEKMRLSLCDHIRNVRNMTIANERIANELRIARNIQNSMLPEAHPEILKYGEIDIFAHICPAKEVGGDLYDYVLRDNRLSFIIGDASGKGIPASIIMSVTCTMFRTCANAERSALEIVTAINKSLSLNNTTSMFETLIVGILDMRTGAMEFCNAGHTPPLVLCSNSDGYIRLTSNIPAGVIGNYEYASDTYVLDAGSTVLLYTDGVTEAEDSTGSQFGSKRLLNVSLENSNKPMPEFVGAITDAICSFTSGEEQSDDITMLAIRYTGSRYSNTLTMRCSLDELPRISAEIDMIAERFGIGPKDANRAMLAIEEVAVNVINYAYSDGEAGELSLGVKVLDDALVFVFTDGGKPFNPLTAPAPDTTARLEDRKIGGLGILLARKLTDAMSYRLTDEGKNELTMRINITNLQ